jgi:uncharacterized secreted protein with C-terminal beta-propeller domain
MESPAKTALGGSLISALAIGGMVAVGLTAGVVADPGAPPAQAATGLTTFQDCDAVQRWYVAHTIDQVGPYGWGGRGWTELRVPAAAGGLAEDSGAAGKEVANGPTGTNVQEAGVDEPDVAKTDGRLVVQLQDERRIVVTDVTGPPRQLSEWPLPFGAYADGLLLVGDHVLVSSNRMMTLDRTMDGPEGGLIEHSAGGSQLIDLDISDPTHPVLDSRTSWSGSQLSLRQYGDTVRMVTSTGLPQLPFVSPRPGKLTEDQAEERNRAIVRDSTVEDWLPGFSSESDGQSGTLVDCSEVYHPKVWSGADTVAVATFRPGEVEHATAVAVTGAGSEVYSSTDRLYVTSTDWGGGRVPMGLDRLSFGPLTVASGRTHVHAFALTGSTTRYVASGSVDGTIRDRWSLDEHDGHLRVAVSWPDRLGNTRDNGIVVLDEQEGRLETVGELRGLGTDEDLQSVRWFDDLAVLVTFRKMDPLYTVDLTDPSRPRRLGELKIPGFSSYLHPIGDDRLLGLGTDATTEGQSRGAQVGVFELADPTRTRQVDKVTFGLDSWLNASEDPHAFTWLPSAHAAITTLQRMDRSEPELVLLRVSTTGVLGTEDLPSPGGQQPRALPLNGDRVALVGTSVRVVEID